MLPVVKASNKPETALLVMDTPVSIVKRFPRADAPLAAIARAVGAARHNGVPVVHVVITLCDGHPEVSDRNPLLRDAVRYSGLLASDPGTDVHPALVPAADEVVVVERRVSAFAGTELDVLLRSWDVRHLVLCGFTTSGVVLATAIDAVDRDFELTVLADGCTDHDEEIHRVLLDRVLASRGRLAAADDAWWSTSMPNLYSVDSFAGNRTPRGREDG